MRNRREIQRGSIWFECHVFTQAVQTACSKRPIQRIQCGMHERAHASVTVWVRWIVEWWVENVCLPANGTTSSSGQKRSLNCAKDTMPIFLCHFISFPYRDYVVSVSRSHTRALPRKCIEIRWNIQLVLEASGRTNLFGFGSKNAIVLNEKLFEIHSWTW